MNGGLAKMTTDMDLPTPLLAVGTDATALPLPSEPVAGETLTSIKSHLDLVLLALESLTGIGSDGILQAAVALDLEMVVSDRVGLWRLRQSNPQRQSAHGRKTLDVEEARALVLMICHLAAAHQSLIRRAVTLLEQMTRQGKDPYRAALLGDYLDRFTNTYHERMKVPEHHTPDHLTHLACKLLVDLLFYSVPQGGRRLWLALFDFSLTLPPGNS